MAQIIQFPTKSSKKKEFSTERQAVNVQKILIALENADTGSVVISVDTMQKAIDLYFKKHGKHSYPTR
jgi:hypothetical protein